MAISKNKTDIVLQFNRKSHFAAIDQGHKVNQGYKVNFTSLISIIEREIFRKPLRQISYPLAYKVLYFINEFTTLAYRPYRLYLKLRHFYFALSYRSCT